jgi:hypothetical protein
MQEPVKFKCKINISFLFKAEFYKCKFHYDSTCDTSICFGVRSNLQLTLCLQFHMMKGFPVDAVGNVESGYLP